MLTYGNSLRSTHCREFLSCHEYWFWTNYIRTELNTGPTKETEREEKWALWILKGNNLCRFSNLSVSSKDELTTTAWLAGIKFKPHMGYRSRKWVVLPNCKGNNLCRFSNLSVSRQDKLPSKGLNWDIGAENRKENEFCRLSNISVWWRPVKINWLQQLDWPELNPGPTWDIGVEPWIVFWKGICGTRPKKI